MNVSFATLLSIGHTKLTDFGAIMPGNVEQSTIADLSPHFRVTRRLIEDDIDLIRLISRQHSFDDRFGLEKVVTKKFRQRTLQFSGFDSDCFFLLGLPRPLALLLHQFLEAGNIDRESALARH